MKGPKLPAEVREMAEALSIVKKKKEDDWITRTIDELSKASPTKQCAIGAAAGAVNGYVCGRVGKNAALVIGGSLVMLQVASHMGYIKINWNAVEKDLEQAKKDLRKSRDGLVGPVLSELKDFLRDNMYLGGGFIGGFIIGLATA